MTRFLLCTLMLSGCADPCEGADLWVGGACIHSHGYDVDVDMIEATIEIVEDDFNARTLNTADIDLNRMLVDYRVSIEFVETLPTFPNKNGEFNYYTDTIYIRAFFRRPLLTQGDRCFNLYAWALSHELLHFLDDEVIGHKGHWTPYLWNKWALDTGYEGLTVESTARQHIRNLCY